MNRTTILAALAPALLLGGCVSLGEGKAPPSLLTLTPRETAAAGAIATGSAQAALALVEFEVPRSIDVTRVPVQVSDTEIAYLKDAEWVERPARLFRRVVAETVRARSGRMVIDGDDPGVVANDQLAGTLRSFGYDARSASVVVVFDATRNTGGAQVTTKRFEARVSGVPADVRSVAPALNQAANEVAGQIADWVG
ncbi:MAG: ABC-type transport auxiliary lipoprotein family protein [Erythrobacter sp.]|jgi:cholesterol transport system auxiliary component